MRSSVAWQKAMELGVGGMSRDADVSGGRAIWIDESVASGGCFNSEQYRGRSGRLTQRDFLNFLGVARGSALEVETQLELAMQLGFGDRRELEATQQLAVEVGTILNASIATIREKISTKNAPTISD